MGGVEGGVYETEGGEEVEIGGNLGESTQLTNPVDLMLTFCRTAGGATRGGVTGSDGRANGVKTGGTLGKSSHLTKPVGVWFDL